MKLSYSENQKRNLVEQYRAGASVASLCTETGISSSTFYSWIKHYQPIATESGAFITAPDIYSLKRKIEKLENMMSVLKTVNCTVSSPMKDRLNELELLYGQFSVHVLCEALDVPRGTFYNHILRNKRNQSSHMKRREELRIAVRDAFDDSNQIYGADKIKVTLANKGCQISVAMVTELMREMGLYSIRTTSKRSYTKIKKYEKKTNVLQRNFHATDPNRVWVSDITYFKLKDKFYYICVIIDLFSRKVVAHKISQKNCTQLVTATFKRAYALRNPSEDLLFHSDRGTQYTSYSFQKLLRDCQVKQSFSNSGRPCDNAVAESFFSSLKQEELYRKNYRSESDFKKQVADYIVRFNTERPHRSLLYRTPDQVESGNVINPK
ncbi:MAG: IS3 family transposase [Tannerella sp.]|nr:IS3 family transposase [Tannerella sp.]